MKAAASAINIPAVSPIKIETLMRATSAIRIIDSFQPT